MISLSLPRLVEVLDAELIVNQVLLVGDAQLAVAEIKISQVTTDTRANTNGSLFIALKGERFDGHDFAEDALATGVVALLVSRRLPVDAPQLLVKDTRLALGKLAAWVRQQVPTRLVALTGSSGKTSVKEMAAAILRQCGNVLYTQGNFNNDIGVPLTLLRLTTEYDFAVIELGANHINEIAYTVDLVRPQTALVNNLSVAHLQGFGSLAGVAQAKGEIFGGLSADGIAIINADSHDWAHWQTITGNKRVWRFSPQKVAEADFFASDLVLDQQVSHFTLNSPFGSIAVTVPLPGAHNVANALAAAALAMSVGASLEAVQQGLSHLQALPGRLFPLQLSPGKLLLDDSYNANVGSMTAAVETLAEMPGYRVMVVGDMAELGDEAESYHRQIGETLRLSSIDKVLSVGLLSKQISDASGHGEHFRNQAELVVRLSSLLLEHQTITVLIKGSRSAAMENIIRELQERALC